MKICPSCKQIYADTTLSFCLDDGAVLNDVLSNPNDSTETVVLNYPVQNLPNQQFGTPNQTPFSPANQTQPRQANKNSSALPWILGVLGGLALLCGGGLIGLIAYLPNDDPKKPAVSPTKTSASPSVETKAEESSKTESNSVKSPINSSPVSNANSAVPADSTKADLTPDKYKRIKLGMTYSQVEAIMGTRGIETSSSQIGEIKSGAYSWEGEKAWRIAALFTNDKLYSKSQSNYPKLAKANLNLDKFNRIKVGMTHPQVEAIIGAEGMETRSSDIGDNKSATFEWGAKNLQISQPPSGTINLKEKPIRIEIK